LNDLSRKILKGELAVQLTQPTLMGKKFAMLAAPEKIKAPGGDGLFERLRVLRKELAQRSNVPAYVVFSDRTLLEMAGARPQNDIEMLAVSGVGEHKLKLYGKIFLDEIRRHLDEESKKAPEY